MIVWAVGESNASSFLEVASKVLAALRPAVEEYAQSQVEVVATRDSVEGVGVQGVGATGA